MPKSRHSRTPVPSTSASTRRPKQIRSCQSCHERKVSCDQQRPSCSACRRHARTLGLDADSITCSYSSDPTKGVILEDEVEAAPRGDSVDLYTRGKDEPLGLRTKRGRGRPRKRAPTPSDSEDQSDTDLFQWDEPEVKEEEEPESDGSDYEFAGIGLGKDPRRRKNASMKSADKLKTQTLAPLPVAQLPTPISSPVDKLSTSQTPDFDFSTPPSMQPPSPPYFCSLFSGSQPFSLTSPPLLATPIDDGGQFNFYDTAYPRTMEPNYFKYSAPTPLGKHASSTFSGFDLDDLEDLPSW